MSVNKTNTKSIDSKEIWEDVIIPSSCDSCLNQCPINVRRVNGVIVSVEGKPDSKKYDGLICGKGAAAPMYINDPNRVNYPLLRTNPEKGHGVDPKWKRISWDEALDLAAKKLKKAMEDDPRKLLVYGSAINFYSVVHSFVGFMGTTGCPNLVSASAVACGNSEHLFAYSRQALCDSVDWQYTNYVITMGSNLAAGATFRTQLAARRAAEGRERGMKQVCIDPVASPAVEIADEWVPIIPGTDGALLMAMMYVLFYELKMIDTEYLKEETNLPYLIRSDGLYLRDPEGNPMMYDLGDGQAKSIHAEFKDLALDGAYNYEGVEYKTAYVLVKESVSDWSPERAAKISDVPAATIRRLTKELAEAAQIGATTVIDGKVLRYRPAAIIAGRGVSGHDNATITSISLVTLGELLGLPGAVGGNVYSGSVSRGYKEGYYNYDLVPGTDGHNEGWFYLGSFRFAYGGYPIPEPKKPTNFTLAELNPLPILSPMIERVVLDPKRYGVDINSDNCFMITVGGNWLYNIGSPDMYLEAYKKYFTCTIQTYLNDSVTAVADLVLPGTTHLERLCVPEPVNAAYQQQGYPGLWEVHLRQPAVAPQYERRGENEIFIDLIDRIGQRTVYNMVMNLALVLKEPHKLQGDEKYSWEEMVDRYCKSNFGDDKGLEWFKVNNHLSWPVKMEEWYWPQCIKTGRMPVYTEFLLQHEKKMRVVIKENNIDYPDDKWYAVPHWHPCAQLRCKNPSFDLSVIYYKHPLAIMSYSRNNAWLEEFSKQDIVMDYALINRQTAQEKGIADDDEIIIESENGAKIQMKARLSELVHPQVIAVANGLANESPYVPAGKGAKVEWLLTNDWDHLDKITMSLEADAAVKVRKVEGGHK